MSNRILYAPLKRSKQIDVPMTDGNHTESAGLTVEYQGSSVPYIILPGFSNRQHMCKYPLTPNKKAAKPAETKSLYSDVDTAAKNDCTDKDNTDSSTPSQQSVTKCGHMSRSLNRQQSVVRLNPDRRRTRQTKCHPP